MPRLPYADLDAVPADERELLERGGLMLKHVLANAPGLLLPLFKANGVLLASPGLEPLQRTLLILDVASRNGSEYVWVQQEHRARALGATDRQLDAIRAGEPVEGDRGVLLRYVRDLYAGDQPGDDRLEEVLRIVSVRGLVEAITLASIYMLWARLAEAAGMEPEEPVAEFVSASLVDP